METIFGGLADGILVRILEEMMGHTIVAKEVTDAYFIVVSWFGKLVNFSNILMVGAV